MRIIKFFDENFYESPWDIWINRGATVPAQIKQKIEQLIPGISSTYLPNIKLIECLLSQLSWIKQTDRQTPETFWFSTVSFDWRFRNYNCVYIVCNYITIQWILSIITKFLIQLIGFEDWVLWGGGGGCVCKIDSPSHFKYPAHKCPGLHNHFPGCCFLHPCPIDRTASNLDELDEKIHNVFGKRDNQ